MQKFLTKQGGFTLIELFLTLTIVLFLFITLGWSYLSKQREIEFEMAVNDLKSIFYTAREDSRNYKNNQTYGVHLESNGYNLFGTNSGALLTTALPQFISIEEINLTSSGQEIIFEKNSGNPDKTWDFSFKSADGDTVSFEINSQWLLKITSNEN